MKKFFTTLILLTSPAISFGNQEFIEDFAPNINIIDRYNPEILGIAGYGVPSNGNIAWDLTQWRNTSNLEPEIFPENRSWEISNENSRIKFYPYLNGINNVYELAASNIPCSSTGTATENNELNMFLQPSNMPVQRGTLANIGQLKLLFDMNITYKNVGNKCPVNHSGYIASVILSTGYQSLFVQINAGGTSGEPTGLAWCPDYENSTGYGYENSFCVDQSISDYGGEFIYDTGGGHYNLDILPGLIDIIKSNHIKSGPIKTALDPNPSHWFLVGFYLGLVNYGDVTITSTWSKPKLASSGGTFCPVNGKLLTQFICESPANPSLGWVDVGSNCYHRISQIPC